MKCILCDSLMHPIIKDLYRCEFCSLVSSSLGSDKSLYNSGYYEKYKVYANTQLGFKINKFRWDFIKQFIDGGVILDYGCGYGHFVKLNPNHTFFTKTYDINPYAGATQIPGDRFDAVAFWDVLEHMDNPVENIRKIDTDWIFGTVPDISACAIDYTKWRHYRPYEHVHHFSRKSIGRFLYKLGFRMMGASNEEGAIRNPETPGWLLTFCGKRM